MGLGVTELIELANAQQTIRRQMAAYVEKHQSPKSMLISAHVTADISDQSLEMTKDEVDSTEHEEDTENVRASDAVQQTKQLPPRDSKIDLLGDDSVADTVTSPLVDALAKTTI